MPNVSTQPNSCALMVLPRTTERTGYPSRKPANHPPAKKTKLHRAPVTSRSIIVNFIAGTSREQNLSKEDFSSLFTDLAASSKRELATINSKNEIKRNNDLDKLFFRPKKDEAVKEVFDLLNEYGSDLKYNSAEMINAAEKAYGLEESFPEYKSASDIGHAETRSTVNSFNKIFQPKTEGEFKKALVTIRENGETKEQYQAAVLGIEKAEGRLAKVQLLKGVDVFPSIVIDPQFRQWRNENTDLNAKIKIETSDRQFRFSAKTGDETRTVDFKLID